ncbi:MSHA biogenesis protein MshM [Vibrio galatheae]|uniref:MSHA biogenesis protein MshM n=1 Tax=Vibrio galatheae TaxID=579748 RepID=A0A0F4NG00_9VIBR|nr:AAA family ATPase [Vibrio galatheae]KJY82042.1 MSHA biogenesis protein MshM [Vibrio galatheae]
MYLDHFGFENWPFHLTPDTEMFLGLAPHFEAIQMVNSALEMGEGLIKVTGEVGTGKTMICRLLVKHFKHNVQLVFIPNPALNGSQLRLAVAAELGLECSNEATIVDEIHKQLIQLKANNKHVVVLVDEAQALSDDALEVLRLFGNLETEQEKLLQIILLGQPELDQRLAEHHLRQFRQRITFSATLRGLTLDEGVAYINNRLVKAGGSETLFNLSQKKAIWRASSGYPRLINQIGHKALLLACSHKTPQVTNAQLYDAIHDTYDSCKPKFKSPLLWGWSE